MNNPAMGEYGMNVLYPNPGEHLRLAISEKSGVTWELSTESIGPNELYGRVARVDGNSVVIARTNSDHYGISQPSLKFFFDLAALKLLKTITFDPSVRVTQLKLIDNRVCATVKAGEIAFVSCGDEAAQKIEAQLGASENVPEPIDPLSELFRSPIPVRIPQSTYDQFAK